MATIAWRLNADFVPGVQAEHDFGLKYIDGKFTMYKMGGEHGSWV